jgi:sn-glycerol 3-phosphate transport system ATP-binding protein
MDEPLSNLDAQLRGEMRREIRALQRRLGITMVYVTHDQTEAMTMADRVVLLRAGRIEQVGSPEELYARPATAFTAAFIGAPPMNLLRLNGAGVLTGVRPEDMRLAGDGLQATVESVEYLGADSLVAARSAAGGVVVRMPGRAPCQAGEAVRIAWEARAEHHFDEQTGGRKP